MIRLGIVGACGRMGRRIASLALADDRFAIAGAVERSGHECCGRDYGSCLDQEDLGLEVSNDLNHVFSAVDVLIDFAVGDDVLTHVQAAREKKVAMVLGTTGLGEDVLEQMQTAALDFPFLMSPNMGLGVNVLLAHVGDIAASLGSDYAIDIRETHHDKKKDPRSGTALKLAEVIGEKSGRKVLADGQSRKKDEILVHPGRREGDVVGEHTIVLTGRGETLEITHRAANRDVFAFGALEAAAFMAKAKAGRLYSMADVIRGGPCG